jgi:ankyrin repeat protein
MDSPELPEGVLSATRSGNVAQLQDVFRSGMSVEMIAREAAEHSQPAILEWCFAQGWEPHRKSYNDQFFLSAATGASPAIFQMLIDHGWDINGHETEACGDALACAVMTGDYDFAKWLLEHGHRATPIDPYHGPSSISATVRGDTASIKMLKLLLDHGHDLSETGAGIAAADEGNVEGLRVLLDAGIDTEDRKMLGWYPFDEDKDEPYESEGTALYRACRQGHLECVKLLLDRGADAQAKDDGGTSCLSIAKKRGHQDVVKLLEERGVSE